MQIDEAVAAHHELAHGTARLQHAKRMQERTFVTVDLVRETTDDTYDGFDWIDFHDAENSVVSFLRKSRDGDIVAFVVNATPMVRYNYRLGVPESGFYREIINTDAETYGGSNVGNLGGIHSEAREWMGREHSMIIHLPPLATVAFKVEK
jgi:1,4-alpha-glucan branching enzyme